MTTLNFGTLNVRGFKKISHNDKSRFLHLQTIIAINKHSLDALAVQETQLLFCGKDVWAKKDGMFDVSMGAYDGAEVAELVGLLIISKINDEFPQLRPISG